MSLMTDPLTVLVTRLRDTVDRLPVWRDGIVATVDPLTVRLGGETVGTPVSWSGVAGLAVGDQVMCLHIWNRLRVLGRRGGGPAVIPHYAQATAGLVLSTTFQTVPGLSMSLALRAGDVVQAIGVFDQDSSSNIFLGRLLVDGVEVSGEAHAQNSGRITVSQVWQWTVSADGTCTVALSAGMQSGSATLFHEHTGLTVNVYRG